MVKASSVTILLLICLSFVEYRFAAAQNPSITESSDPNEDKNDSYIATTESSEDDVEDYQSSPPSSSQLQKDDPEESLVDLEESDEESSSSKSNSSDQRSEKSLPTTSSAPSIAAVFQEGADNTFNGIRAKTEDTFLSTEENSFIMSSMSESNGHQEICDFCIYDGEGNFTSYGYPLPYRSNLKCSYRVQRGNNNQDSCELELIFHDFDVPVASVAASNSNDPVDCYEDYLLVGNQRYCGSSWRGKTEVIFFPADKKELVFTFVTNERVSGRGFWVEVRRRPNTCYTKRAMKSCEERYSDTEFYITSPQFPSGYPNNADCTYHIRRSEPSVCGLEIKFLHFDLEKASDQRECTFDYLEIDGHKFCGSQDPKTVKTYKFEEDQKVILFHSDRQVPRSGFHLLVRQLKNCPQDPSLPPPPTCNICTHELRGLLVSYSYPKPYRNNLNCNYTIDKHNSNICGLELHFLDFQVVPSLDCTEDYLKIGSVRYCGTTLHSTKQMIEYGSNSSIEMHFHTDSSNSGRGFNARYRQVPCSAMKNVAALTAKERPVASSSFAPLLPTQTPSTSTSSASSKPTGKSFDCSKTFNEKQFLLQSYNYSNNYPNNMECDYVVFKNTSKVCYLELTFLQFDVEASPQCQYDFLEVNNVRLCGTLQRETTRTYIFDTPEKSIKFHSDNSSNRSGYLIKAEQLECHGDAIIRNMSDASTRDPIDTPPDQASIAPTCDQLFGEMNFEIISPLYPSPYPKNSDCVFMVAKVRANICRLEVTYYDFDLQGVNDYGYCSSDYLDFNGIRMCGQVSKASIRNYYFPESKFAIRFHADSLINGRGFRLGIRQSECDANTIDPTSSLLPATSPSVVATPSTVAVAPVLASKIAPATKKIPQLHQCDQVFTEGFVEITSPKYPANYPTSMSCQYTIIKPTNAGPICQLELHVLELELDESSNCHGDFLDFEREIFCGSVASKTVKFFPFDRSEFIIRFRSDDQEVPTGRRAFHIQIRQRECPDGFSVTPARPPSEIGTPSSEQAATDKNRLEHCGTTIKSAKFELKSPSFPSPYEKDLDCSFTIKRSHGNICFMDLFFMDFQLEDDKDCRYDYLSIEDRKYCGHIKPGVIQTYPFTNRTEIVINFKTDRANSGRGFYIRGAQRECISGSHFTPPTSQSNTTNSKKTATPSPPKGVELAAHQAAAPSICEVCFASREGVIKSYNYPNNYPSDLSCNYRVAGLPDHCAVYLKIEHFDLEDPQNGRCDDDFLQIGDVRYCGSQLENVQKLIDFTGDPSEMVMRFHSNSYISGSGFKILYAQIPCSNLGVVNQRPVNQQIDRQIPQIVAGSEPISVLESSDLADPDAKTRVPCDLVIFDNKFEISTPGYPISYPARSDCLFSVRRANYNVCKLKLEFALFDLESSPHCRGDRLEVEGEKLCGSLPNNTMREYEFTNYKLALRFSSDEYGSRKGFFIRGEQIECPSGNKPPTPFSNTPSFPSFSASDTSYSHQSSHSSSSYSTIPNQPPLSAPQSDLPSYRGSTPQSETDSGSLSSSGFYPPSPSHQTRNGHPSLLQPHSSIPSDSQVNQEGYFSDSSYTPSTCDRTIMDSFFDIKSPNFPFRYPPGSKCSLIIKKSNPQVCHLDLMFVGFDVGTSLCNSDFLSVDGERFCASIEKGQVKTFRFDLPEKFIFFRGDLGQGLGYHIRGRQVECSPSHYMTSVSAAQPISGISSSSVYSRSSESSLYSMDRGQFPPTHGTFSSQLPYCDQSFTGTEFTIMSPNHPNDYPSNLFCRFTIHRLSTSICALDMLFKNFDVEEAPDCSKDYLEIDGSKICGLFPPLYQRRYNYFNHEKEKTFIFRSDSFGSKSGFSIHVTQVTGCPNNQETATSLNNGYQPRSELSTPRSQCNQCMKDLMGQITSENYPKEYPNSLDCNYRIAAAGQQFCKVLIYIRDLDMESSEACDKDYFFVEGQRLCNANFKKPKEMTVYFPEYGPREITLSFHSNGHTSGRGFFLDFMQQTCSLQVPLMPASIMSRSPIYPANHVARATIEEIVETKVQVLDQRPTQRPTQRQVAPSHQQRSLLDPPSIQTPLHSVSAMDSIYVKNDVKSLRNRRKAI